MKNKILIYMILSLVTYALHAQVVTDKKTVWDYPVKPGMEEWNRLKTEKERIAAVQIPEEILVKLSAEEVAGLCISFPLFGDYTAFNTPQEGFYVMLSRFNIFRHLLSQKEAGKGLIAMYKDAGMSGFGKLSCPNDFWTIKLDYLELVLSQKEIIQSLTLTERIELIAEARKKFSEQIGNESLSSLPGLQSTARIMAVILNKEKYRELKSFSNRQKLEKLEKTGIVDDAALLNEVVEMTDNFIKDYDIKK
jgi:hypothetical protein